MAQTTTTTQTPTPDTPMYRLVATKFGRDPIEFIHERRSAGLSYARIATELVAETGEYHTAELVRRWDLVSQGRPYRRPGANTPAATEAKAA